jgi:hypothetical protein
MENNIENTCVQLMRELLNGEENLMSANNNVSYRIHTKFISQYLNAVII